ncbi:hypothetical protein [Winogradskyella sp.]|uniref:hypothetical protein n=1 Tax=Winogradskyella sp. TaxID=1883156 RepID=UPI0025EA759B|nr:hypothetical protein [Winogradskyella sp.]
MTHKKLFAISLGILGVVVILFSTGSSVLTYNLFGIPAGNLIIWIGFIAIQLAVFSFHKGFKASNSVVGKLIRNLMRILIGISILWFGIAYILSGNIGFNFSWEASGYLGSPKASILYWKIIYVLVVAPVVLMISYSLLLYFERLKDTK